MVLQPSSTGAPAVNPTTGAVEGFLLFSTSFLPSGPTVRVERSETGETWESVATAVTQKFHRGSYRHYGNVGQPVSGWWRAVHDGTPDFFAASTSAAVHLP
ncbi:hypothetical protein [Actinosynnema pretiosum]|uniref:Uncharacterized protein n=1 Tax=Actinosynnema pretiosum TaxID=42197 RepID=A0A290Z3W4_9PSEU|nr:hypothetical protein [Actinosynnema pretiosum]ATE53659.1 hypothetical protein CNX65_10455 [Actinosynnema pretiosum]